MDWNLFARTERCYLKRYRGDTNSQLTILLDASNSMDYTGCPRAAEQDGLCPLRRRVALLSGHPQPARRRGLDCLSTTRCATTSGPLRDKGQLHRLLAGLEQAEPRARTDFHQAAASLPEPACTGAALSSCSPISMRTRPPSCVPSNPLRYHGNEVVLCSTCSTRKRLRPDLSAHPPSWSILRPSNSCLEVIPEYARTDYSRER